MALLLPKRARGDSLLPTQQIMYPSHGKMAGRLLPCQAHARSGSLRHWKCFATRQTNKALEDVHELINKLLHYRTTLPAL